MVEGRQVFTSPNQIWTSDQFWKMARKIAKDILDSMEATGHPLPGAMKSGNLGVKAAAHSVLQSVVANINGECMPAGNA